MILKLIIFSYGFSSKVTFTFLLQDNRMELSEFNTFKPSCENYNMFHIIDQIQYSMIPL